jgi:tRNA (guanine37-N1)-methyltransferase
LNLRDEYLPYKQVIAEVLIDKNPTIRTVINKVDDVGTHSEYRTFGYEVLAGPDDMNVELSEENCIFKFDYSKVYWNSRLQTEHKRLVDSFNSGEVVCDVMAGIGPFAIPAGKKRVFVWANDLNPDSYAAMMEAIKRNKVSYAILNTALYCLAFKRPRVFEFPLLAFYGCATIKCCSKIPKFHLTNALHNLLDIS